MQPKENWRDRVSRIDPGTLGAPRRPHRFRRALGAMSLVAAAAGAAAALVAGFIVIAGVSPSEGIAAWIALPVLVTVWLSGLWSRWYSPDRRRRTEERGRRGF